MKHDFRWISLPVFLLLAISIWRSDGMLSADTSGPPVARRKIILHGPLFEPHQARLRSDAAPLLDEAVRMLRIERPPTVIVAKDVSLPDTGRLTSRRARSLRHYLVAQGIAAARVRTDKPDSCVTEPRDSTMAMHSEAHRVELYLDCP
jgi:hypothetical protein